MHTVAMLLQDSKFHDVTDMEFRSLLTDSMEHSPSLEVNLFSANQRIPRILWNMRFNTAFVSAHSEVYIRKN